MFSNMNNFRMFRPVFEYILNVIVGHMKHIGLTETEYVALLGLMLWSDGTENIIKFQCPLGTNKQTNIRSPRKAIEPYCKRRNVIVESQFASPFSCHKHIRPCSFAGSADEGSDSSRPPPPLHHHGIFRITNFAQNWQSTSSNA
jgi:hypothetical protein